jgi:hypothetical protein
MKVFKYKDEEYIQIAPAKALFKSTTIWEVVNRGDVFAMRVSDQVFTVIPGKAAVEILWFAAGKITITPPDSE